MNIVCGDALGISCGTWVAFWNGAIGAFVAAVLGGLVALLVVRLTNAQQRRASERAVEIAAIADFVAVVEEALDLARKGGPPEDFDRNKYKRLMRIAVIKLGMSGPEAKPVFRIIQFWPYDLTDLMSGFVRALHSKEPYAEELLAALIEASSIISTALPRCSDRPLKENNTVLHLGYLDERLQESIKLIEDSRQGVPSIDIPPAGSVDGTGDTSPA